jgi:hypothetical protein
MQMELSVPKGDFLAGQSVPLFIPSSVRREWQVNGVGDESRVELETEFAQIRGYEFEWGQIVEDLFDPAESGNDPDSPIIGACWHFVLVDLHNAFLDGGGNLGELSDLAVYILEEFSRWAVEKFSPRCKSKILPEYIDFDEGNTISVFAIDVLGTKNVERARKWVATFFIPCILPLLIMYLQNPKELPTSLPH